MAHGMTHAQRSYSEILESLNEARERRHQAHLDGTTTPELLAEVARLNERMCRAFDRMDGEWWASLGPVHLSLMTDDRICLSQIAAVGGGKCVFVRPGESRYEVLLAEIRRQKAEDATIAGRVFTFLAIPAQRCRIDYYGEGQQQSALVHIQPRGCTREIRLYVSRETVTLSQAPHTVEQIGRIKRDS